MELETQPIDKENEMHSSEEKKISELETQQSRETSSKETFQQADKANEDLVSQNVIGSDEKVNPQDHPINRNVNNSKYENKQSSKINNKESLQPIDKENDSDEKDNLVNPQQKEILYSDDTIISSNRTIFIQKSVSSKTQADEAVADKAESYTSFQPIDIQKQLDTPKSPLQVLSELSSNMQEINNYEINNNDNETLTDDDNRNADDEITR